MRKVFWRIKAMNAFQRQKLWYLVNKDEQFVNTYQENIHILDIRSSVMK